jgi:hypothetical protein
MQRLRDGGGDSGGGGGGGGGGVNGEERLSTNIKWE